jgi:two-component sensor histidine kinase
VKRLAAIEKALLASPDKQISLTDPDCRSMATSGRGSGMVAYNVQSAVDTTNHLLVAHEVTNVSTDRSQLATMAQAAKAALRSDHLDVVALAVSDNDPGKPDGVFAQPKTGLGTGVVKALSKQLDAQVVTMSGALGTKVSVTHATFAAA